MVRILRMERSKASYTPAIEIHVGRASLNRRSDKRRISKRQRQFDRFVIKQAYSELVDEIDSAEDALCDYDAYLEWLDEQRDIAERYMELQDIAWFNQYWY